MNLDKVREKRSQFEKEISEFINQKISEFDPENNLKISPDLYVFYEKTLGKRNEKPICHMRLNIEL